MQASIQFFGAGAPDAGPNTVMLNIDGRRYMFNCGPGTQRCALQHGLKFAHLEAVFFTSLKWDYYGGFKGMASTLADIYPYSTELKAPEENKGNHCCVGSDNEDAEPVVSDVKKGILPVIGDKGLQEIVDASYSFLKRSLHFLKIVEQSDYSFYQDALITVRPIFHNAELKRVATPSLSDLSISSCEKKAKLETTSVSEDEWGQLIGYVIQGPSVPGKFDVAAARAKGVKPGPDFRRLLNGEKVILEDGRQVTSEGIVSSAQTFPTIVIAEFKDSQLPPYDIGIFFSERGSQAVDEQASDQRDYYIRKNLTPVLSDSFELEKELSNVSSLHSPLCSTSEEVLLVKPMDELILFPERNYKFVQFDASVSLGAEIPKEVVITLGTGAAMPGKYRNVSSTLYLNGDISCLFDCGEATYGQLCRKFGFFNARKVIDSLQIVGVSHLHSDHHLGLLQVLEAKKSESRLNVYAPKDVINFLNTYVMVHQAKLSSSIELFENQVGEFDNGEFTFEIVPVDHCPNSFGFVIKQDTKTLVVYSGDTRPCQQLISRGMNTHVLIHEASMPDDLPEEAVYRKHCTASEAIDVSKQINAKLTILTHLSQRYGRTIPTVTSEGVIFASDFMTIPLQYTSNSMQELERMEILNKE